MLNLNFFIADPSGKGCGKPRWIKLSRSVFSNTIIMGRKVIEPYWKLIQEMILKRSRCVYDPEIYIVRFANDLTINQQKPHTPIV